MKMSEPLQKLNLLSVLRDLLRSYGTETDVHFQTRSGSCRSVNFELTDATRSTWSDIGAMISLQASWWKDHQGRWSNPEQFENS